MKGGTDTPAQTVTLGDETYQVMSACKPHDPRLATYCCDVVRDNESDDGAVLDLSMRKRRKEKLTWLNVNDALSIDGKTVLFAALTGSLEKPSGWL
ncbi:Ivy family c-type lysozyme inhibitor [Escherichia coli]